ncbi:hypothetical protein [Streptomyces sp. NPDC053726]|uniref:hypothetical protein n=1 Tax=Streptomyces sp. NPDC053726 TaxID=3365713 RepID=UPI0037D4E39E
MTSSFSPSRSRRLACAASVLTVVTVAVGVLILALEAGLPEGWWPRTGQAFAIDSTGRHGDSCAWIVGPAEAYCERGSDTTDIASTQESGDAEAWKLVPASAAVGALVVWRRGTSTGRGRR